VDPLNDISLPKAYKYAKPTTYGHYGTADHTAETSATELDYTPSPHLAYSQYDSIRLGSGLGPYLPLEKSQHAQYGASDAPSGDIISVAGPSSQPGLALLSGSDLLKDRKRKKQGRRMVSGQALCHSLSRRKSALAFRTRVKDQHLQIEYRLAEKWNQIAMQAAKIKEFKPNYSTPDSLAPTCPLVLTLATAKNEDETDQILNTFVGGTEKAKKAGKGVLLTTAQKALVKSVLSEQVDDSVRTERLKIRNMVDAYTSRLKKEKNGELMMLKHHEADLLITKQEAEIQRLTTCGPQGP
jgi:hypothetical protein